MSGTVSRNICTIARGGTPSAIRSSARVPSLGSVMFCDATTPMPARRWAQRAPTAGEEDAIAIASHLVSRQHAEIENVTTATPSISAAGQVVRLLWRLYK